MIETFFKWLAAVLTFLFVITAIASCTEQEEKNFAAVANDTYRFEQKEYEELNPSISIVLYDSQEKFDKDAQKALPRGPGIKVMAYSTLNQYTHHCTIHMVDPLKVKYAPEFMGHELAHCIWGDWHPKRDKYDADFP